MEESKFGINSGAEVASVRGVGYAVGERGNPASKEQGMRRMSNGWATLALVASLAFGAPGVQAQGQPFRLVITPFMVKGVANAPVTIFEFSDYQ